MELLLQAVFMLHIFGATLIHGAVHPDKSKNGMVEKEGDLRTMLNTVMEQNRQLVLQNKRLQKVWFGMKQMCEALSIPACDCGNTHTGLNTTHELNEKQFTHSPSNSTLPLTVLSIKSERSISGATEISVTYTASDDHYVSWIGPRVDGTTWRKIGNRTQAVPGSEIYTSTVNVEDIGSFRLMFFRLYSEEQSISITLNTTAAQTPQEQNVTVPYSSLIEIDKSYIAAQNSDLTITAVIHLNMSFMGEFSAVQLLFVGLNTSANPPAFFEKFSFDSDCIGVSLSRRTNETTNYHITIKHPYVQHGGFLTILIPYIESSKDRMIDELRIGPTVRIFPYGINEIIPYNTAGIMTLTKQTIIFPPSSSILCFAIGNPRPNATIHKLDDNGNIRKLATETTYLDRYTNGEVLTLSASQRTNEGHYICRASNGNKTVESATDAVVLRKAVIDESKTGIVKNTSTTIVISCKAKGNPRPQLDFRLYEEYGPFMIKSGLYKFEKIESGKYTSRVTLTLSPTNDADVHTVYCYAAQGDKRRSFETSRKIEIFPFGKYKNWDLYARVRDAEAF